METKETLHLFRDEDGNVYAARDLNHAKELWTKDTGQPAEDAGDWQCIPDDTVFRDEDSGEWKAAYEHAAEVASPGCVGALS